MGRDKEHSTIIYEAGDNETSLLRLGWNKQDPRYMATLIMDTCKVSNLPAGPDRQSQTRHTLTAAMRWDPGNITGPCVSAESPANHRASYRRCCAGHLPLYNMAPHHASLCCLDRCGGKDDWYM